MFNVVSNSMKQTGTAAACVVATRAALYSHPLPLPPLPMRNGSVGHVLRELDF